MYLTRLGNAIYAIRIYLGYQVGQLPVSEQAAREVLSLPMFPGLTFEEQERVAYGLKNCLK